MATIRQYVDRLWDVQQVVARQLGYDLRQSEIGLRAAILSVDITLAVLVKVFTDAGVITDAALNLAFNRAKLFAYPPLSQSPVIIPEDGSELPGPDIGEQIL